MFALYWSLVTSEGRRTMRSTLLVTSLFVGRGRVCIYGFFHRLASIYVRVMDPHWIPSNMENDSVAKDLRHQQL